MKTGLWIVGTLLAPTLSVAGPAVRAVDPPGFAPEYGFVADAPTSDVVFARQVLPAVGVSAALAQSRVIYLNHTGAILRPSGTNDSGQQLSTIVSAQTQIPAWTTSAQTWTDTVTCFRDLFSRFDVQVVDADPGPTVPHIEALFGGTPGLVGLPSNVGGVSPFTTDCSIIESSIVFTFVDAIPNITSRQACEIMAQEVAHSYGLDHELLAADPMTYLAYNSNRAFQDQTASCGESTSRVCGINGSQCRANQNSVQLLLQRVGTGDPTPPALAFSSPADGAIVPSTFDVKATGTDNIAVVSATMTIDTTAPVVQTGPGPFVFTTPTLTDGPHTIKVEITDGKNVKSETHTVTVQAGAPPPGEGSGSGNGGNDLDNGDISGGCSTTGGSASALLGVGLAALVLRRRRR